MVKVEPFADRILVKLQVEKPEDDFLIMPQSNGVKDTVDGLVVTSPFGANPEKPQVGDLVAFNPSNGTAVEIEGVPHIVIREEYVIYRTKEEK